MRGQVDSPFPHLRTLLRPVLYPPPGQRRLPRLGRALYWLALAALLLAGAVLPARWRALVQGRSAWTLHAPTSIDQTLPAGTRFRDCADDSCPWLVVLPAGRFTMGSPPGEDGRDEDEGPQHEVTIGAPFAVMEAEVTRGQYRAFMTDTRRTIAPGCRTWNEAAKDWKDVPDATWERAGYDQADQHPVVCVNWNDAQAYALWLSRRTGADYRLLSEAQWEYAARAGSQSRYSFGDDEKQLCRYGNVADRSGKAGIKGWKSSWIAADCDDGAVYTAAVKRYQPNAFGLYDLHGNAWEWVQDCWDGQKGYDGAPTDGSAVEPASAALNQKQAASGSDAGLSLAGSQCSSRLLRGGAWSDEPWNARSANRNHGFPAFRGSYTGLRLARMLPEAAQPLKP